MRDTQGVRDTFASIFTSLGPVDILVNNAGVFYGEMTSDGDFDKFWRAVEINFKGTMFCMYQVLPKMRERKSGCIVNISSRAATVDYPGGMSYSASKAAVARATATLQEEFEAEGLGDYLHTYSLHPGGVWGAMAAGKLFFSLEFWTMLTLNRGTSGGTEGDETNVQRCARAVRQYSDISSYGSRAGAAGTVS